MSAEDVELSRYLPKTRGRPPKEADPNFPKRIATRQMKKIAKSAILREEQSMPKGFAGTNVNTAKGNEKIGIFPGAKNIPPAQESLPPEPGEDSNYFECNECGTHLAEGMPECPGCAQKLDWSQVK